MKLWCGTTIIFEDKHKKKAAKLSYKKSYVMEWKEKKNLLFTPVAEEPPLPQAES